jgi:hypothetical protein
MQQQHQHLAALGLFESSCSLYLCAHVCVVSIANCCAELTLLLSLIADLWVIN